jgi:DNA-binding SARP family transcriptional activator
MQRAVLALLCLDPGVPVPLEGILDALWGSRPPANAVRDAQTHVSRLRAVLRSQQGCGPADRIEISRSGRSYILRAASPQLDLLEHDSLVLQARQAAAAGEGLTASLLYLRALSLWTGQPLSDLELLHRHPAVTALAARRISVTAEYAAIALGNGEYAQAQSHLAAAAGADPLNEGVHALLMLALAGGGQQARALGTFHDIKQRLDAQLGVRPGRELQDALLRVLRHEES